MNIFQLFTKEHGMLLPLLQEWSKMANAGLKHEGNAHLIERLSDCQKMCEEIETLLRTAFRLPELSIHISKDTENRVQAIMTTWKRRSSIAILKIVTCPWNISSLCAENSFPVKRSGTSLVFRAIDIARENGLSVELTSLKSAKVFYERIGFKTDATKKLTDDHIFPMILSSEMIQQKT